MSIPLYDLTEIINRELKVWLFKDYAPNGLQVEGKQAIQKIVSGVTACRQLLGAAVEHKADAVLVHHGYFWKGEDPCVTGMKKQRLSQLISNKMSLLAYHLPLDAHPTLGNNAMLAKMLSVEITGLLCPEVDNSVGNVGVLPSPVSIRDFSERISEKLNRQPLVIEGGKHPVRKVALCTGAAQDYIDRAVKQGADVFISGEISERTVHTARESGIHYIAAGHHATERYGVMALGEWLQERCDIEHVFVDIFNPA